MKRDWWSKAGVLIAGGALCVSILSAIMAGAVWTIDHRIADQVAPIKVSLARIELRLGIPPERVAAR